jgi:serine/threonine protein kinase
VKRVPRDNIKKRVVNELLSEIEARPVLLIFLPSHSHEANQMMSRLHHPNIIQFLGCVFEPYVCLVLELAALGSLKDVLAAEDFVFSWSSSGMEMALVR